MQKTYSDLTPDHIAQLCKFAGKFIHDEKADESSTIFKYLQNYRPYNGVIAGKSPLVLLPQSNDEISNILKYCNENRIRVFPQGGNSGLVGGSTPDDSGQGVVISLQKMNKVLSVVDSHSQTVKLQSGIVVDTLNEKLGEYDLFCSIKHGGTGLATIGGSVATNAGGANALKYGVVREQVVGLTVVLTGGEIKHLGGNIKDNSLPINPLHLFIGSEGTLGIITEVEIKVYPKPASFETAILGMKLDNVDKFFGLARKAFAKNIEAFEFMQTEIFNISRANTKASQAITEHLADSEIYVLMEVSSQIANDDVLKTEFQEFIIENEALLDDDQIALAFSGDDREKLWAIREHCSDSSASYSNRKGVYFDNAVPLGKVAEALKKTEDKLKAAYAKEFEAGKVKIYGFGHWGDGNIHHHVVQPAGVEGFDIKTIAHDIENIVLDYNINELGGSYSAEHGNGAKLSRVLEYADKDMLSNVIAIKKLFDPNSIMNPNRAIPLSSL